MSYVISVIKLNVERQGEGGTLALNDVNITIGIKFMQEFLLKRNLKVFQYLSVPRVGIGPTSKP